MPFSARNIFIIVARCSSFGSFQYKFINCNDSFLANGSFDFCSDTRGVMRPLRFGSGMYPGNPWKKNDIGVSRAELNSNNRDAEMRFPALSYF